MTKPQVAVWVALGAAQTLGFGCGGNKPGAHEYRAPTAVVSGNPATFAAAGSPRVVEAAMIYPDDDAVAREAPMSLTASDGTGLRLVSIDARAVMHGPLAFTELHLTFENPADRIIEGRFAITLPQQAAISRLAMKLSDGSWQEAEVVEKMAARRAYEDFLHRRQDPALLEKDAGNEFRARVFPIPARGRKEIIISYSQELAATDAPYRLHLVGLPAVQRIDVTAFVGEGAANGAITQEVVRLSQRDFTPERDFEVPVRATLAGVAADDLVVARIAPRLATAPDPLDSVLVLFDTSASRAPGFAREVERLGSLISAMRRARGDAPLHLHVACFDQSVQTVFDGDAADFGSEHVRAILARRPLGASDVRGALAWAGTARGFRRVVVVTDGVATAGEVSGDALHAAARGLDRSVARVDVIAVGGIRDDELMTRIVRGTRRVDGAVIDGDDSATELAARLGRATMSGIDVAVAGAAWVWPRRLDGVQAGDEAIVFARLEPGRDASEIEVRLSGALDQSHRVKTARAARPLVERAVAGGLIASLTAQRDALPAGDPDTAARRADLRTRITDISTRHRVLSDYTALLVLETEDDYARFGIDRRALADILIVGAGGLEVTHRDQPVMIAVPAPAKPMDVTKTLRGARDADDDEDNKETRKRKVSDDGLVVDAKQEAEVSLNGGGGGGDGDGHGAEEHTPDEARPEPSADEPAPVAQSTAAPPSPPSPRPAPARRPPPRSGSTRSYDFEDDSVDAEIAVAGGGEAEAPERPTGPPPYTGPLAAIMDDIAAGRAEQALIAALRWRAKDPGDVMALIALGESLEAAGHADLAARAYGSIIDLFPSRADMRRFAGARLERIRADALAADSYASAAEQRPDHPSVHRMVAYARLRAGDHAGAFAALEAGLGRSYPDGRFAGAHRVLRDDLGIVAAAWLAVAPDQRAAIERRLAAVGASLATEPSLRFVLTWETDANDVDFHIYDGQGGHAFYSSPQLASGGELFADVTTGYGPECFAIPGKAAAYPYALQIHYYSRGPMGYGMGKVEIVQHDGRGGVRAEQRPFVVMNDGAYVDLGTVTKPM